MKRIITFMMALALTLSLGITAFAADGDPVNGSITVSNAVVGSTYSVYKIFDATYNADGDTTYTITPNTAENPNPIFVEMFGADGTETNEFFEYHAATGVVTRKSGKTDAELFAYLKSLVENETSSITAKKEAESQEIKFTGLDAGYYVIKSENAEKAVAVSVTSAKPDAVVNDKNNLPGGDFTKEFDNGTGGTANVGDVIEWKLSFTAVNYSKDQKVLKYTIKDNLTPDDWAAIDLNSIEIKVGEKILDPDKDEWTFISKSGDGFEIEIPWVDEDKEFIYDSTVLVEVTYSATVLEKASDNPQANKNSANMEWELENGDTPGSPDVETDTHVYNLGFTKVDGTNTDKKLAGATFELYGAYDEATKTYSKPIMVSGANGVFVYDSESTSNAVVTPEGGAVVIKGLEEGTYYLKETAAPDGYNLLTDPVEITVVADEVDADGNVTKPNGSELKVGEDTLYVNHAAVDVANFTGVELPSTGGKGTMLMITFGSVVAMAFAMLLITQKKMSIYRD